MLKWHKFFPHTRSPLTRKSNWVLIPSRNLTPLTTKKLRGVFSALFNNPPPLYDTSWNLYMIFGCADVFYKSINWQFYSLWIFVFLKMFKNVRDSMQRKWSENIRLKKISLVQMDDWTLCVVKFGLQSDIRKLCAWERVKAWWKLDMKQTLGLTTTVFVDKRE